MGSSWKRRLWRQAAPRHADRRHDLGRGGAAARRRRRRGFRARPPGGVDEEERREPVRLQGARRGRRGQRDRARGDPDPGRRASGAARPAPQAVADLVQQGGGAGTAPERRKGGQDEALRSGGAPVIGSKVPSATPDGVNHLTSPRRAKLSVWHSPSSTSNSVSR